MNTLKYKAAVALLAAILVPYAANAKHSETNRDRSGISLDGEYSEKYDPVIHHSRVHGGADVGNGGADVGNGGLDNEYDLSENQPADDDDRARHPDYSSVIASELRSAHMMAAEYAENGEFHNSRAALVRGFRRALRHYHGWHARYSPLAVEALKRGIKLDRDFRGVCEKSNHADDCMLDEAQLASYFLATYAQHIVERVLPLDEKYVQPYYSRCDYDWGRAWWSSFITDYNGAAKALIDLFNGNGVNHALPRSLKFDTYELNIAEDMLLWTAYDLNRDMFRRRNNVAIGEAMGALRYIRDLREAGRLNDPYTKKRAVFQLRATATRVGEIISTDRGDDYETQTNRCD